MSRFTFTRPGLALSAFALFGLAACAAAPGRVDYQVSRNAARIDDASSDLYAMDEIRTGNFAAAEVKLRDTTRLAEDDPYRLLNLALVLQMTGRQNEASALYGQVLDMESNPKAAVASGFGRPVKDIAQSALARLGDGNN